MKNFNALILSKDLTNISRFVDILKSNCHIVSISNDQTTLSEIIATPRPNLILIDSISLQNSPLILRFIKNRMAVKICPIIVITHNEISDEGVAYLRDGASDYISINISDEEFLLRAQRQLELHQNTPKEEQRQEPQTSPFESIYPLEDREKLLASMEYLTSHMEAIKNVADLALGVGITERKLNELYKQHTQLTAAEYIRNSKTKKAKDLLSTTRMNMYEIAVKVGYSNAANFSTAFKHAEGITPSQYKNNLRNSL
ncbi:MAG: DNA-binding response regulator [Pelistega sp.]|nr:DNA-binding response regulator [Pelistega sp.]